MLPKELIQPPRGMRDFSPKEMEEREALRHLIEEAYKSFGYRRIGTPVLENIEVLDAKGGEESKKLTYRILKRGDQLEKALESENMKDVCDLGLRFDLTVPLCRYVATHSADFANTQRIMRIDPVWRAERPQKGRFREFIQCDIDVIGAEGNAYEIELLTVFSRILKKLGLPAKIKISDRRLLQTLLRENGMGDDEIMKIVMALDKRDKIGNEKVLEEIKPVATSSVYLLMNDMLSGENIFRTDAVLNIMDSINEIINGVKEVDGDANIVFDPFLMRGLDYYTGTVFEVELEGLKISAGGGGRYDNLVGTFLGKQIPAVGFSFGFERILTVLADKKITLSKTGNRIRMVSDKKTDAELQKAAGYLREKGLIVDIDFAERKFDKKMKAAENDGIRFVITDFDGEEWTLRDMAEKKTENIKTKELIQKVI